jgi:hypothetical protein
VPDASEIAEAVAAAQTWDAKVTIVRRVPESFGTGQHAEVYAAIASRVYAPSIEPDFAYVHWRDDYELTPLEAAYELARAGTSGFTAVRRDDLARIINEHPQTLRVFRLLLGLITAEFSEACSMIADKLDLAPVGKSAIKAMEAGRRGTHRKAATCAAVVDLGMTGGLFPPAPAGTTLRRKTDKPDTAAGWTSVRAYATFGVPLPVLLHQRAYGGAFRQLLDATSSRRGDVLEVAVQELLKDARIPFIRTGAHNQDAIAKQFGLTVRPAPDFVILDPRITALKAILECKVANDGGTARDKAARFRSLRTEAQRLGGVPVIAVLGGIGWRRSADALGPVVRDTDGRTFTVATLGSLLELDPFPSLCGLAPPTSDDLSPDDPE